MPNQDDVMLIRKQLTQHIPKEGFQLSGLAKLQTKTIFYWFLCGITAGLFFVWCRMYPWWRAKFKYVPATLDECEKVVVQRMEEGQFMYDIAHVKYSYEFKLRYFDYMCQRYIYDPESGFDKAVFDVARPFRAIQRDLSRGLDDQQALEHQSRFGRNNLDVPVPHYGRLFISEVLHPFYIFQIASCAIWYWDQYWIYATCILFMSSISAVVSVYQARKNREKLAEMTHSESQVTVLRNEQRYILSSTDISPGDLIVLEANAPVPCDCILLNGNVVVNESSLTGESIPVMKSPLPKEEDDIFDPEHHGKYALFNGTTILQVKQGTSEDPVLALAFATGFFTLKGQLIRSIMFPKPTKFKFYKESFRFVLFLAGLGSYTSCQAACGFLYTVVMFVHFEAPIEVILKRALDLVTIAVPPALPVAMTIGTAFAVARLKEDRIYCIAPTRVNVSGQVDVMCFDKTGTLTEEGLSVFGLHACSDRAFHDELEADITQAPLPLMWVMAACHSLNLHDGKYIGDPLDIQMFESTSWTLMEDPATRNIIVASQLHRDHIEIVKYFEFSSALMRMSVIARRGDEYWVFSKGSPEVIKSLASRDTLPDDFDITLGSYTHQGKRVIALASRKLGEMELEAAMKLSRTDCEQALNFHALFILQNRLKDDTRDSIRSLQMGRINNVMVTGDNDYTAISVARQCNIIAPDRMVFLISFIEDKRNDIERLHYSHVPSSADEEIHSSASQQTEDDFSWSDPNIVVAVSGKAFAYLQNHEISTFKLMLDKAKVYSRMSPLNKTHLVEALETQGLTVGMCGDGSNDCGALKAADVGLSLSEAEASVAAPFTSQRPSISSVYTLLREGRASLATSIQVYKYMAIYSMLQTMTIMILYSIGYESRLKDAQFLWIDLGLIFPLSFLMGRTRPRPKLSKKKPPASLLAKSILGSIGLQLVVHAIFQASVYSWTSWNYLPANHPDFDDETNQNTRISVLFVFSNFQYIASVLSFSIGKPFRMPMWSNVPFLAATAVTSLACAYMLLIPDSVTAWLLTILYIEPSYRVTLLIVAIVNAALAIAVERVAIVGWLTRYDASTQAV